LLLFVLAGCGGPQAEFVFREETQNLTRDARQKLEKTVVEAFGTPEELAAWLKMPVDFGRFNGKLAKMESPRALKVQLDEEAAKAALAAGDDLNGCGLLWTSGGASGTGAVVESYDSKTRILHLRKSLDGEAKPKPGAEFTVAGYQLRAGRRYYHRHCMHCHGVSGDGNGPTAQYLNPLPRDYRLGIFKFTNIKDQEGASRDDLARIIKQGIPGTYMPSFMLLPDNERVAIIEYVRFLAMRGQFEKGLADELNDFSDEAWSEMSGEDRDARLEEVFGEEGYFPDTVNDTADQIAENWNNYELEESVIVPGVPRVPDTPESRRRGRELFMSKKAQCASCHGASGLGNGPQTYSRNKLPSGETAKKPGLFDRWGHPIQPRNLTRGIYRGGRRPYDIYCRITSGIKGTPMAGFKAVFEKEEDIWNVVNYVLSIPQGEPLPNEHRLTKGEHGEESEAAADDKKTTSGE
jgi:mono/diheme cytochrome c family protein